MIYIIIPVFNRFHYTQACIISLLNQTYPNYLIVIVDHGSTDGTTELINKDFPSVVVLKGDSSMWWTAATNLGVKYALENKANYILTLNNDLVVGSNYLTELMNASQANPKSIIGSVALDIDDKDRVVYAGVKWNSWIAKYHPSVSVNLSYSEFIKKYKNIKTDFLPGRGTLIPSEVFKLIGLFNEVHFPHYMADEDFSLRAQKAGYPCFVNTSAAVYSHYKETGLSNKYKEKKGVQFIKDNLTSIKSPNNISVRWNWAKFNARFPLLYFSIDFSRVFISLLIKSVKA